MHNAKLSEYILYYRTLLWIEGIFAITPESVSIVWMHQMHSKSDNQIHMNFCYMQ